MGSPGVDPLLARLASGDEQAFETLYERFAARMYWAALRMLSRPEDAEDVVQEVFVSLVRGRAKLTAVNDLAGYVFAALRRAAGRTATREDRQPMAAGGLVADSAIVGQPGRSGWPNHERLERALRALPPLQREVITLKIDAGLTFTQIGQVLQVSPDTAASRYRYALEKLRTALGVRVL